MGVRRSIKSQGEVKKSNMGGVSGMGKNKDGRSKSDGESSKIGVVSGIRRTGSTSRWVESSDEEKMMGRIRAM